MSKKSRIIADIEQSYAQFQYTLNKKHEESYKEADAFFRFWLTRVPDFEEDEYLWAYSKPKIWAGKDIGWRSAGYPIRMGVSKTSEGFTVAPRFDYYSPDAPLYSHSIDYEALVYTWTPQQWEGKVAYLAELLPQLESWFLYTYSGKDVKAAYRRRENLREMLEESPHLCLNYQLATTLDKIID